MAQYGSSGRYDSSPRSGAYDRHTGIYSFDYLCRCCLLSSMKNPNLGLVGLENYLWKIQIQLNISDRRWVAKPIWLIRKPLRSIVRWVSCLCFVLFFCARAQELRSWPLWCWGISNLDLQYVSRWSLLHHIIAIMVVSPIIAIMVVSPRRCNMC